MPPSARTMAGIPVTRSADHKVVPRIFAPMEVEMTKFNRSRCAIGASAIALALVEFLAANQASAQMFREPFSFETRNRASMAVYMHQMRNGSGGGGTIAAGQGNQTLVCAGTGSNTATSAGNILCVIAGEGANVIVGANQETNGNQTSDATTNQTAAEEINEILNGEPNG